MPGVAAAWWRASASCRSAAFPAAASSASSAADRLDFRGPVQAQHPAQRVRRDRGGALGAGLAQQRHEHQHDQHDLKAVEPVPQPPVYLPRAVQQPGARQRRQREQQPGQRVARARREYRRGSLAQQPERASARSASGAPNPAAPQAHPAPAPRRPCRCPCPRGPGLRGRRRALARGRAGQARHAADRGFRHSRRGGDRGLAGAVAVQLTDPPDHLRGQLRGPPRPLGRRDQARDPAGGQRPGPPPHARRDHPERLRHLHLGRGLRLDQLDRRQPARRQIPRNPTRTWPARAPTPRRRRPGRPPRPPRERSPPRPPEAAATAPGSASGPSSHLSQRQQTFHLFLRKTGAETSSGTLGKG